MLKSHWRKMGKKDVDKKAAYDNKKNAQLNRIKLNKI